MSRLIGIFGENQAERYLKKNGYKILCKNYHSRFGEIDIIALDKSTTVFVEVKKRGANSFAGGAEFVTASKQSKIIKTALFYLQSKNIQNDIRFDVIEINCNNINHIKDAFYA